METLETPNCLVGFILHLSEVCWSTLIQGGGAQERTRTSTSLPILAPEASASTNSATWAGVVKGRISGHVGGVKWIFDIFAKTRLLPERIWNFLAGQSCYGAACRDFRRGARVAFPYVVGMRGNSSSLPHIPENPTRPAAFRRSIPGRAYVPGRQ